MTSISSPIHSPIKSAGVNKFGGLTLPRAGLIWTGPVDTIGLSIAELYPLVDPLFRTIISADGGVTKRADADIVTLALASPLINTTTMIGTSAKGVAFYRSDASSATLTKAYRYFGKTYGLLAYGSVAAGLQRFSYVSSAYFADFGAGVPLKNYPGAKVVVSDGSKMLVFFVPKSGAAGTGETYGSNIFNNADFATDEPAGTAWTRGTNWTVAGGVGVASASPSGQRIVQNTSAQNGFLYRSDFDLLTCTAGAFNLQADGLNLTAGQTVAATYTSYFTSVRAASISAGVTARNATTTGTIDNASFKRVLSPSGSGVWMASTVNGAAGSGYLNFETSFNPNLITGAYTYNIYPGN